jgi:cytochrome c553
MSGARSGAPAPRRRRRCALAAAASLCTAALPAIAQAPSGAQAGAARPAVALQCVACHGPLGISSAPDAPHLAGQPAMYLVAQMKAFRGGARKHEVMNVVARPLSDGDIDAVATWFSSIKIEARSP